MEAHKRFSNLPKKLKLFFKGPITPPLTLFSGNRGGEVETEIKGGEEETVRGDEEEGGGWFASCDKL